MKSIKVKQIVQTKCIYINILGLSIRSKYIQPSKKSKRYGKGYLSTLALIWKGIPNHSSYGGGEGGQKNIWKTKLKLLLLRNDQWMVKA